MLKKQYKKYTPLLVLGLIFPILFFLNIWESNRINKIKKIETKNIPNNESKDSFSKQIKKRLDFSDPAFIYPENDPFAPRKKKKRNILEKMDKTSSDRYKKAYDPPLPSEIFIQ